MFEQVPNLKEPVELIRFVGTDPARDAGPGFIRKRLIKSVKVLEDIPRSRGKHVWSQFS